MSVVWNMGTDCRICNYPYILGFIRIININFSFVLDFTLSLFSSFSATSRSLCVYSGFRGKFVPRARGRKSLISIAVVSTVGGPTRFPALTNSYACSCITYLWWRFYQSLWIEFTKIFPKRISLSPNFLMDKNKTGLAWRLDSSNHILSIILNVSVYIEGWLAKWVSKTVHHNFFFFYIGRKGSLQRTNFAVNSCKNTTVL